MRVLWRKGTGPIGRRGWAMAGLTGVVMTSAVMVAGLGLAFGSDVQVMGVRFGGDAQRTRVVIDLGRETRGRVLSDGSAGQVSVALSGVSGPGMSGQGGGLVRSYEMDNATGGARLNMQLARNAEIERRFLLPPGDGVAHYRYVIDLKSTGAAPVAATVNARAAPARTQKPLIVIDAGHGGRDPGAQGADGWEKAITMAAARDLKAALERTGRYRVRLTRDGDVYVAHNRRVQVARDSGADLFISLHADAGTDPSIRGASVYTLSEQGATRAVREFTSNDDWQRNLRLPGRDASVDRILLDMTQRATQNRSAQFARVLLNNIESDNFPTLNRSHRAAGLAVLLAPDVPAVLLEMGFITNADDERSLSDERTRRRMMRSVAEGIDRYFRDPTASVQVAANKVPAS